jgi:hypothetical protein
MFLYVKVIILGLLLSGAAFTGWYVEHLRFSEYKIRVESLGKEAEIKTQAIQSEHQQAIKVLQDEHDAKLNLIRQYYANGVRNPSSSTVSSISNSTRISDAITAYNELAGKCAETTLQVTEWQKWYEEHNNIWNQMK